MVLDGAGDGDGITNGNLVHIGALHAVADHGSELTTGNLNDNGNVLVLRVVQILDVGDLTGQGCLIGQSLIAGQGVGLIHDLNLGSRLSHSRTVALGHGHQSAAGIELDGATVVLDGAADGDGVTNSQSVGAGALHAVALDGLLLTACHGDGHGDILVSSVIGLIDGGDHTGQSCNVRQSGLGSQRISGIHDGQRIGGSKRNCFAAGNDGIQRAALSELNGAVVVHQNTGNGDHSAHAQSVSALALHAVALDGLVLAAGDHDGDSDVTIAGIIGLIHGGDGAGEGCGVGQRSILLQSVSVLNDLHGIGRSLHSRSIALDQLVDHTAGIEFDGAAVVLQSAADGDGITNSQSLSALALQTVALDGHIGQIAHDHGAGQVLVAVIIGGVDHADHTGENSQAFHGSVLFQSVGSLNQLFHGHAFASQLHALDHVVEGDGLSVALSVGDGSGSGEQDVGAGVQGDIQLYMVFLGGLSHGNAVSIALGDLNGPCDGIADAVNHHRLQDILISGDDDGFVLAGGLVHAGQVLGSALQTCRSLLVLTAACEQAQNHSQKKHNRNQFLHRFLPSEIEVLLMHGDIFRGEYFDLIIAAEIVNDAVDIDGPVQQIGFREQLTVVLAQNDGSDIHGDALGAGAGQGHGAIGITAVVGGVDPVDDQVLHTDGGAHGQICIGEALGGGLLAAQLVHDLQLHLRRGEGSGIGELVGGAVALTDLDGVAGIHGLELTVLQTGNLPGSAGFVVSNRTHDASQVANLQVVQQLAGLEAIVHGNTVVHLGLLVKALHIDGVVVIAGDHAFESDLAVFVQGDVGAQTLQVHLVSITVEEIGIFVGVENIDLLCFCLLECLGGHFAVALAHIAAGDGQTVLDQLQVQAAVIIGFSGLIPDPNQMTAAGGVHIPLGIVGFHNDGGGILQSFLGEGGGLLAPGLDLAGGLGGVDAEITGLQDTVFADVSGNIKVGGITVDIAAHGDFSLERTGIAVQLGLAHIVHDLQLRRFGDLRGLAPLAACKAADCQAQGKNKR